MLKDSLRKLRRKNRMSQEELADRLFVSRSLIFFVVILLLFALCSCALTKTRNTVLSVRNAQLNRENLEHAYDLDGDPIVSINDQKESDTITVTFVDIQYDLKYKDTIEYVIGEVSVDEYVPVDNNNQCVVLLLPDGEIYAILASSIGKIDIESTADEMTVKHAVEFYLKEEIDFGLFDYCDITCSLPDISNGFGLYSFVWYNKIGDVGTDHTINLCVSQNGEISALWMKYRSKNRFEDVSDSISIDDYQDAIKDKIDSIFGDDLIEYNVISAVLTHYNDSIYLDCTISVSYSHGNIERLSEACRILLPVVAMG